MATETFLEKGFVVTPDKFERFQKIVNSRKKLRPKVNKEPARWLERKEIRDFLKL